MEEETRTGPGLFTYKGFNMIRDIHDERYLDTLEQFEVKDDDIFVATYPKSGTTWMQCILTLMYHSETLNGKTNRTIHTIVPWFEVQLKKRYEEMSPRTFVTHLLPSLLPQGLRKRGKVIYVARNPKDVATSYYHFHNITKALAKKGDIGQFLDEYMEGKGSWFEHVNDWINHKDEFNLLFLTFEEMKKDLRGTIIKISEFLGKTLDDETLDMIVENSSFRNMKNNPKTCSDIAFPQYFDTKNGSMLRKGKVGDWKKMFTVDQNEKFDRIYQEKMSDFPRELVWYH